MHFQPLVNNTAKNLASSLTAHCFCYKEINGKGTAVSGQTLYKVHNQVKGLDKKAT